MTAAVIAGQENREKTRMERENQRIRDLRTALARLIEETP